jgi:hypothetical protein
MVEIDIFLRIGHLQGYLQENTAKKHEDGKPSVHTGRIGN